MSLQENGVVKPILYWSEASQLRHSVNVADAGVVLRVTLNKARHLQAILLSIGSRVMLSAKAVFPSSNFHLRSSDFPSSESSLDYDPRFRPHSDSFFSASCLASCPYQRQAEADSMLDLAAAELGRWDQGDSQLFGVQVEYRFVADPSSLLAVC